MTLYEVLLHSQPVDGKGVNGVSTLTPAEARALAGLPPADRSKAKKYLDPDAAEREMVAKHFGVHPSTVRPGINLRRPREMEVPIEVDSPRRPIAKPRKPLTARGMMRAK